ncbi:MAG: hypothetical protein ACLFQK_02105 [Fibrobacterota bacterium]
MKQFVVTPAAGKRLIGIAVAELPEIKEVLENGTLVIIAGSTNAYVAEEILKKTAEKTEIPKGEFLRGVVLPPGISRSETGILSGMENFFGDVVIKDGKFEKGKTIFDMLPELKKDDMILKGANCLDLKERKAGVLIGHPEGGTIHAAVQAAVGKRTSLLVPIGLEKRVEEDIDSLAAFLNKKDASGPRLYPVPADVFTELDAFEFLTGAEVTLAAAGGICGAEGASWIVVEGSKEQEEKAQEIFDRIKNEPSFRL